MPSLTHRTLRTVLMSFILAMMFFLFALALFSCATITLKPPTIQDTAYTAGHVIAVANPELAREFIEYSQLDREDILTFYPSWKRYLESCLSKEDFLVVKTLLTLVDVRLEFKTDEDKVAIIRRVFLEFISGLEDGVDASN